jgi:putative transposase
MAIELVKQRQFSIRLACKCVGISQSGYCYMAKQSSENALIVDWLLRLTTAHKRCGFGLWFLYLRNVQSFLWNHKRVYRNFKELELNLHIKPRKRLKPDAFSVPIKPNQIWSMGFMIDSLRDCRCIRLFKVIDECNREGLTVDLDLSMLSALVIRSLDRIIEWQGKLSAIRCDR